MPNNLNSKSPFGLSATSIRRAITQNLRSSRRLFTGEFARKGYLAAMDQGLISLTNFLAAIYLARQVSPTEFGIYAVGFAALHLVRGIQEGVVVQPINALGSPMDLDAFRPYASATGILQLIMAGSIAAGTALLGSLLTWLGNDTAGPAVTAMWFMFFSFLLQEYIRRTFYARNRVPSAVVNTALASFIRLGALYLISLEGALSGVSGLDAIGWGALFAFLVGMVQARDFWTRQVGNLRRVWRENWLAGRWILGGTIANWVALEVYPVLAAGMISFAAAGVYRALQVPVAPVHAILRAADTFITPRAAQVNDRDGRRGISRLLQISYLLIGLPVFFFLVFAVLFSEPVLSALYGSTYLPYQTGMIFMATFYGLWYLYWPLQSVLKGLGRTIPVFVANLVAVIVMFTLGVLLIRQGGLYGTIAGQALNALVVNVVLWSFWIKIRKTLPQPSA